MSRKGSKTITVSDEEHEIITQIAKELEVNQREIVTFAIASTFSDKQDGNNTMVGGIDVNLLLEDLAKLTKRVAELENANETLIRFIRGKFPRDSNKLTKLLNAKSDISITTKLSSEFSVFGQEDSEITTEQAISRCLSAVPVSVDPISTIPPVFSEQKESVPEIV
jgi:hypothetical protein